MRATARRIAIGAAAGVLITLAAASGVSAYWQAQQTVRTGIVTSGDLHITADWADGQPNWHGLYPGGIVEGDIAVAVTGTGDNLQWVVDVHSPDLDPAFSFQAWNGPCGSETPMPMPATGSPDQLTVCVRFTLISNDNTLQGETFTPEIVVTARQVAG